MATALGPSPGRQLRGGRYIGAVPKTAAIALRVRSWLDGKSAHTERQAGARVTRYPAGALPFTPGVRSKNTSVKASAHPRPLIKRRPPDAPRPDR